MIGKSFGLRPRWPEIARRTASASFLGTVLQVAIAAHSVQPVPIGVLAGGFVAVLFLVRRGISLWVVGIAALIAGIAAGVFWEILSISHADRWATVPDAALCPLIAVGFAWIWTRRQGDLDNLL
jgi:hypothetical protein